MAITRPFSQTNIYSIMSFWTFSDLLFFFLKKENYNWDQMFYERKYRQADLAKYRHFQIEGVIITYNLIHFFISRSNCDAT